jgi:hypothetical protein
MCFGMKETAWWLQSPFLSSDKFTTGLVFIFTCHGKPAISLCGFRMLLQGLGRILRVTILSTWFIEFKRYGKLLLSHCTQRNAEHRHFGWEISSLTFGTIPHYTFYHSTKYFTDLIKLDSKCHCRQLHSRSVIQSLNAYLILKCPWCH